VSLVFLKLEVLLNLTLYDQRNKNEDLDNCKDANGITNDVEAPVSGTKAYDSDSENEPLTLEHEVFHLRVALAKLHQKQLTQEAHMVQ